MTYVSLNMNYEGVRMANNNFIKLHDIEIEGLLDTYVKLQGVKTLARDILAKEIIKKLGIRHEIKKS